MSVGIRTPISSALEGTLSIDSNDTHHEIEWKITDRLENEMFKQRKYNYYFMGFFVEGNPYVNKYHNDLSWTFHYLNRPDELPFIRKEIRKSASEFTPVIYDAYGKIKRINISKSKDPSDTYQMIFPVYIGETRSSRTIAKRWEDGDDFKKLKFLKTASIQLDLIRDLYQFNLKNYYPAIRSAKRELKSSQINRRIRSRLGRLEEIILNGFPSLGYRTLDGIINEHKDILSSFVDTDELTENLEKYLALIKKLRSDFILIVPGSNVRSPAYYANFVLRSILGIVIRGLNHQLIYAAGKVQQMINGHPHPPDRVVEDYIERYFIAKYRPPFNRTFNNPQTANKLSGENTELFSIDLDTISKCKFTTELSFSGFSRSTDNVISVGWKEIDQGQTSLDDFDSDKPIYSNPIRGRSLDTGFYEGSEAMSIIAQRIKSA